MMSWRNDQAIVELYQGIGNSPKHANDSSAAKGAKDGRAFIEGSHKVVGRNLFDRLAQAVR
ncbi:MAG: hypothetical protein BGO82_10810 [Devosia sp. 67-54]|nr:MAG: hypothetical protein BGO82_10810 [Devosia sp. 67-54]